jgi:hypothetical protein
MIWTKLKSHCCPSVIDISCHRLAMKLEYFRTSFHLIFSEEGYRKCYVLPGNMKEMDCKEIKAIHHINVWFNRFTSFEIFTIDPSLIGVGYNGATKQPEEIEKIHHINVVSLVNSLHFLRNLLLVQ